MFFDEKFNINQLASQQNQQSSSNELSTIKQNIESNINSRYRDNPNFFIPSKQGIPIPRISSPEKNILQFFSLGNRRNRANDKSTNFAWVIYRLEQPSEDDIEYLKEFENKDKVQAGQNLVRYQITDNPYSSDDFDLSQYKGQVILDKIEKLEFSFWDDKNKRFDSLNAIKDGEVKVNAIKIIIDYLNMNDQKVHRESIIRVGWSNYHYKPEAKKKNNPSSPTGQPGSPSGTPGSTPPGGGQ
jgi:hypothetical protein